MTTGFDNELRDRLATLFFLALAAYAASFFAAAWYAYPAADDWCYAERAIKRGFFGAIQDTYRIHTGIYTSVAAMSVPLAATHILAAARVYAWLHLAFTYACFWLLLRCIVPGAISERRLLGMALVPFCIYLAAMPSIAQGYYWMSASTSYLLGSVLLGTLFALVVNRRAPQQGMRSATYAVLCALAALLAAGSHAAIAVAVVVLSVGGFVVTAIMRRKISGRWALVGAASLVGLGIVMASPGNEVRLARYSVDRSLLSTLVTAGNWEFRHVLTWSSSLAPWAGVAVLAPFAASGSRVGPREAGRWPLWAVMVLVWLAMMGAMLFAPSWSMGTLPSRLLNAIYFVFLAGWFVLALMLVPFSAVSGNGWGERFTPSVRNAARLALLLALVDAGNFHKVLKDLIAGPPFASEIAGRNEAVANALARKQADVTVPAIRTTREALTFPHGDLTDDPTNFRNQCFAEYHGLRSVVAKDDAPRDTQPAHVR